MTASELAAIAETEANAAMARSKAAKKLQKRH